MLCWKRKALSLWHRSMATEAFAPAKINLTLHITGQREDGYHLLDSLVMLVDVGDHIEVARSDRSSVSVSGPMSQGVPTDASNLVIKAAELLGVTADIAVHKALPAMAGIGGGSSDAAATIRALCALFDRPLPARADLLSLGADVPVCMEPNLVRMRGVGEQIEDLGIGQNWPMLLVNPGVAVSTPKVFQALKRKNNPPMTAPFPDWSNWPAAVAWLTSQRNDMQAAAVALQPEIGQALDALDSCEGCELARMSGSGATCFAIFFDVDLRDQAVAALQRRYPNWWIVAAQQVVGL